MNKTIQQTFKEGAHKKFSLLFTFTCLISITLIYFDFCEYENYKELTLERANLKTRVHPNSLASKSENRIIFLLNKIEQASSLEEVENEFQEIEKLDPQNAYITLLKIKLLLGNNSIKTFGKELKILDREKTFLALDYLNLIGEQSEYKQYRLIDIQDLNQGLTKNWPAVGAHMHYNHFLNDVGTIRYIFMLSAAQPYKSSFKNLSLIKNAIHLKGLYKIHQPFVFKIYMNSMFNKIILPTLIDDFPKGFDQEIISFQKHIGAVALLDSTRIHHLGAHYSYYFDSDFDRQAFQFKYGGRLQLLFFNKIVDRLSLVLLILISIFLLFLYFRYWTKISASQGFLKFPKLSKILKLFLLIFFSSIVFSVLLSFILRDPNVNDDVCGLHHYIEKQISIYLLLKFTFLNAVVLIPITLISHKSKIKNGSNTHWTMSLLFPIGYITLAIPAIYFLIVFLEWEWSLTYTVLGLELLLLVLIILKYYRLFFPHKDVETTIQNSYKSLIYLCIFCLSQQILSSSFYRNIEAYHFDKSLFFVPRLEKGSCEDEIYKQQLDLYYSYLKNKPDECLERYKEKIERFPLERMKIVEELQKSKIVY